jgi:hypothetical protein
MHNNVTNLRVARKRMNIRKAAEQAAENRMAHGTPKAERDLSKALRTKASRDLDRHQIKRGDDE